MFSSEEKKCLTAGQRRRYEWLETGSKNKQANDGIVNIDEDSLV